MTAMETDPVLESVERIINGSTGPADAMVLRGGQEAAYWDALEADQAGEASLRGAPRDDPSRRAQPASKLRLLRFCELAAEVDARGPRTWLIRGLWPSADYGVHGAEPKAGKTWNALDMAVSVASRTPWLGALPIDTDGSVIVFSGEGGSGNIVRRTRAIADSRGVSAADLPLWICTRAPHLSSEDHLVELAAMVNDLRPALVVLDPLYLAAGGANGADLYAMGRLLERPQHICQNTDSALLVVTHYNRARDLKGAARLTGAGPAEWGRVLIGAEVVTRQTDQATGASTVLTKLTVTGGEVPDQEIRLRRFVRAVDPDDLDSALEYAVCLEDTDDKARTPTSSDLPPAAVKLLSALEAQTAPVRAPELIDWIAKEHGHGLKRETASRHLNELHRRGFADFVDQGRGVPKLWLVPTAKTESGQPS